MLTQDEARRLVFEYVNKICHVKDDYLDVIDSLTVERPYGWFFMVDCRKFIETHDPVYAQLVGNVPLLVEREGGNLREVAWRGSLDRSIREYEHARVEDSK